MSQFLTDPVLSRLEAAFLVDILAHPEDDTPRLIYADWLEEHGAEERAELIRVQCRLAQQPECLNGRGTLGLDWCCRVCDLRRHERRILSATGTADAPIVPQARANWAPSLRNILPWDMGSWTWCRGFVEAVSCTCQGWVRHGPHLVREYPLTSVKLLDRHAMFQSGQWCWARHSTSLEEAHFVPDCLAFAVQPMLHEVTYPTEDGAHEALSRACLKWARKERTAQR